MVGGYRLSSLLGKGGMGEVWLGEDPKIHRQAAIKVLDARLAVDPQFTTRFLREARAVNEVRHRSLVDVFAFGELDDGRPYLVMEFLEGRTLAALLKERPRLPLREIEPIIAQLCAGLAAAHEKGIIHRDLKPDNIFLLSQEGAPPLVKLLDFGIAKSQREEALTQTGEVFGTPEYMAPEQCLGAKDVDARSDLYSLGIIVYEMLCGRTPFATQGEKRSQIWMRHVTAEPPVIHQFMEGRALPPGVWPFLQRALAKEPKARPQRASEFLSLFGEAMRGAPVAAPVVAAKAAPPLGEAAQSTLRVQPKTPAAPAAEEKGLPWVLFGGVAALLLGVLGWWLLSPSLGGAPSGPAPAAATAPAGSPLLVAPSSGPAVVEAPPAPTSAPNVPAGPVSAPVEEVPASSLEAERPRLSGEGANKASQALPKTSNPLDPDATRPPRGMGSGAEPRKAPRPVERDGTINPWEK
jgi:serine/threonine-protein kinase